MTTITTPVSATIKLYTSYKRDIDNFLKPVLDVLQKQSIIKNDALVVELHVSKHKTSKDKERVEIELEKSRLM